MLGKQSIKIEDWGEASESKSKFKIAWTVTQQPNAQKVSTHFDFAADISESHFINLDSSHSPYEFQKIKSSPETAIVT